MNPRPGHPPESPSATSRFLPQRGEEGGDEPSATERRAPDMHVPGMRTVQEALLMARKQTPFELPARTAPSAGVNIEDLTITELTRLLEDIEHRMSRIKPRFHELNSLVHTPGETFEPAARTREVAEAPASRTDAAVQAGPSLVLPAVTSLPSPPAHPSPLPVEASRSGYEEDSFLARHTSPQSGQAPSAGYDCAYSARDPATCARGTSKG